MWLGPVLPQVKSAFSELGKQGGNTSAALMIYLSKFNSAHFLWYSPHGITTGIRLFSISSQLCVCVYYKDKRDHL